MCLPSIVEEFLKQAKAARLFDTSERFSFQDLLESSFSRDFGGFERLDMFFPFDPCLLKKCDRYGLERLDIFFQGLWWVGESSTVVIRNCKAYQSNAFLADDNFFSLYWLDNGFIGVDKFWMIMYFDASFDVEQYFFWMIMVIFRNFILTMSMLIRR